MKKIFCIALAGLLLVCLASCSKEDGTPTNEETTQTEGAEGNVQVVNPMQSVTAEEAAEDLGLKAITLPEGFTMGEITKINGTPEIYSFDATCNSVVYNVRIAKADGSGNGDISGVYLSEKAECAIYDSADAEVQPSYSVEADKENIKVYCEWNGFYYSISTAVSDIETEDFRTFAVDLVKALIGSSNLAKEEITDVAESTSCDDGVYVMKIYEDKYPDPLSDIKANEIRSIFGRYSMNTFSWDNLPDYTVIVDGINYSYETSSGIITKDDTHADKLSDADRLTLNKIIGSSESLTDASDVTTETDTTETGTFIITKVSGRNLELNKLDGNDTEKFVYSCDIGNLDGSADKNYKVGDYIVLRYEKEIAETYPLQLTVREILPASWNG